MPLHIHDRPRKEKSLHQIIKLMKEPQDWNNLPPLLEGLQLSKQHPEKLGWWRKMVRKAGEAGQTGIIIHCAEMGDRTGVHFTDPSVVHEVVAAIHNHAAAAEWAGEGLDQQIKLAERVVRVIEATAQDRKLREGEVDYRRSPEVTGLILELYAAKAVNDLGKDEGDKVLNCAQRVDALWSFGNYSIDEKNPTWTLSFLVPIWNGIRQALKVDSVANSPAGTKLQERLREIESVVHRARDLCQEEAKGKPRRGLNMYNALI